MKLSSLKSFLLLLISLHLCSCIMYMHEEKYETSYKFKDFINELNPQNPKYAFFKENINLDYYTENNIKKLFGTPGQNIQNDTTNTLTYEYKAPPPQNVIAPLLPLIVYTTGDENYHYAFVFNKDKLETLNLEDLKTDVKAVGIFLPPYLHKTKKAGYNPFDIPNTCHKDFSKIDYSIPHHLNSEIRTNCSHNKLFDSYVLKDNISDFSQRNQGYTKVTTISLYHINNQILRANNKDYEKYIKETFEQADFQRLTDITPIKETNFTGKDISCKIYSKKGKDLYATNRGTYPYLVLEASSAFCSFNKSNVIMTIENSNRFPETLENEINTYEELINTLKTIKYNTPRRFNPAYPILPRINDK